MGDLVERLRKPVRFASETQQQARDRHFADRLEAADAIEALTARLAEAEEALRGNAAFIKAQAEERARIEAERDKLRDALGRASRLQELDLAGQYAVTISDAIRALATQENTNAA